MESKKKKIGMLEQKIGKEAMKHSNTGNILVVQSPT